MSNYKTYANNAYKPFPPAGRAGKRLVYETIT
jgi:hypothetical protein